MSRNKALSVVFVAAAAGLGLYFSRGPWLVYRDQKVKADSATKEMQKAEHEKTDLLREKAQYESPMGREQLARSHRFVKPGEVVDEAER
jgi:hypothetical protein